MIIAPKIRGFICTTAHPDGCAKHVADQIAYIQRQPSISGAKRVLIIGASTGYGLATRIASAFGCGATTIGVAFEKPADEKRTASAGWYNTAAFEQAAHKAGLVSTTILGDAFSNEIKQQTIQAIQEACQQVDLIIYSLASPRRVDPETGIAHNSVLKPIGMPFSGKTVNPMSGEVAEVAISPANADEIAATIKVMGGEDWSLWIDALQRAKVLANGALTIAYSYIGPEITYPIYRAGTIGAAKEDLENTADILNKKLQAINGRALVAVNKAVVTQASAAIPVLPLYLALLFKVMKENGSHEGCIEQMYRLLQMLNQSDIPTDARGLLRLDDKEMQADVQATVARLWQQATTENLDKISDIAGYRHEFYQLFGFELAGVDYNAETDPEREILSLKENF